MLYIALQNLYIYVATHAKQRRNTHFLLVSLCTHSTQFHHLVALASLIIYFVIVNLRCRQRKTHNFVFHGFPCVFPHRITIDFSSHHTGKVLSTKLGASTFAKHTANARSQVHFGAHLVNGSGGCCVDALSALSPQAFVRLPLVSNCLRLFMQILTRSLDPCL